MFIESKNIIIVPNRKTGLMSIGDSLSKSGMFSKKEHEHAYSCGTLDFYNHAEYFQEFPDWPGKDYLIDKSVVDKNRFYLTVRNPFDKVVSSYFFFKKGLEVFGVEVSFDEFLNRLISEEISFNIKIHTIVPSLDFLKFNNEIIDFTPIRFEKLHEDFYNLCAENDIDAYKNLGHVNKSILRPSKDYQKHYNKKIYRIVEELFKEDIDFFKYRF